ncbi:sodium-dependent glucose transporter 1-like [Stegodyphus dumicola]|uniref:sodium-dependent glucose transporter 1-like n=1 Tax=Stegodyphus dumicola TaxID=202533 RepID=UPI0015ACE6A9|nr:sodium-dependent glucose transporter 1-like [Stegodyphus dumicola]
MEANEEQEGGRETARKVVITALLISTYICVGAYRSIPGPTLIDFKHILGIEMTSMPLILTARALGYVAGCLIGGFIFHYLEVINKKKLFMSPFLFIMSMTALAVPFCRSLVALSCTFFVSGICMIILSMGVNVYYFNIWRGDNIYYLTLQTFYAVGSLLGPVIYGTSSQVSFSFINFKTLNSEADSRDFLKICYTYFVLSLMMFCISAMWIGMYRFTSVTIHVRDIFANGESKVN